MSVVIDAAQARAFALACCEGWNSHDLPCILAHDADDVEMSSPFIVERGLDPSGVLRGKRAVAAYWGHGLETAQPPLRFELIDVYAGVDSVVIHYRSVGRRLVMEVLMFDAQRRVIRGSACWGPTAQVTDPSVWIEDRGVVIDDREVRQAPRVGIDYAGEDAALPWRFMMRDHPCVSRPT